MGRNTFGLECLHRSAGIHRPPVTSPWLTRPRVGTSGGVAPSTARPAPGASPSWAWSRRPITADSPTWKGHPARRPSAGRRAGPTKGGWVGLEKRRARRGASAKLTRMRFLSREFSTRDTLEVSLDLKGRSRGAGPYN